MKKTEIEIQGTRFPVYSLNTLIIGSGAAALNAAICLHREGQPDLAIATDNWGGGTSNNAGSDKQTYYKLSLSGDLPESPRGMAEDLARGGCMHGDIALIEAQNSLRAFFHLVSLGVPFPHDRYGAYVGYKTDHDPRQRATSAGPLTSHLMWECLAREVKNRGISILDKHQTIALLTRRKGQEKEVIGALAIDKEKCDSPHLGLVLFNAVNIVLGTGGPAGIYKASVYPESQTGSHGLALAAGAAANNLTESQYGLASFRFRWNLSGTYQQVIPRYLSTDDKGNDEREFLSDYFPDIATLATAIFFKGYQWPFDPRKVGSFGSSLIDILVYQETVLKGRRVFLDYTHNPGETGKLKGFSLDILGSEARAYLERSKALLPTPLERLAHMNQPAIDLYRSHDIDLSRDYLEIAVCAQHNNGGFRGNIWWESNIRHLFPVGEVNGTHGVYRPGGSALNSGQVGGLRAALFISRRYGESPPEVRDFQGAAETQVRERLNRARRILAPKGRDRALARTALAEIQERMSACGAHIRDPDKVRRELPDAWKLYKRLSTDLCVGSASELPAAFQVIDLALTHAVYLEAIQEHLNQGGQSRGSYLVLNPRGEKPCPQLGDEWRYSLDSEDSFTGKNILEIFLDDDFRIQKNWVPARPIPREDNWFENVWNDYLKDNIIK
jgi:succinate dehydrogenase/fumarate reductase flavoprotein subunit